MSKISDLPELEKPREKAYRFGVSTLSNEELLALIISSGTKNCSALELARNVLSASKGLNDLCNKPYQYFLDFNGIKQSKAIRVAAAFEIAKRYQFSNNELNSVVDSEEILVKKYASILSYKEHEEFVLVMLNKKKHVIREETLFIGSENNVSFSLKDVLSKLILNKASYYYMIHNHPNGEIKPSQLDIALTEEMLLTSKKFDIQLVDHLIITKNGYYSFLKQESFYSN